MRTRTNSPPATTSTTGVVASLPAAQSALAIDTQWRIYSATGEWIRAADTKATTILTVDGILVGLAATAIKENLKYLEEHTLVYVLCTVILVLLMVSSLLCLYCLAPKLGFTLGSARKNPTDHADTATSMFFFDHIAGVTDSPQQAPGTRYASLARENFTDPNVVQSELAKQVWALAQVCRTKHRKVGWAVFLLVLALILVAALLLAALFRL